jgi:hypothetical protein
MPDIDYWLNRKYANLERGTELQGVEQMGKGQLYGAQAKAVPEDTASMSGLRGAQAGLYSQQAAEQELANRFGRTIADVGIPAVQKKTSRMSPEQIMSMFYPGASFTRSRQTPSLLKQSQSDEFNSGTDRVVDKNGNGHPRVDTVPAMLAEGEAVLNVGAAERMGRENIRELNKQGLRDMKMDDRSTPVIKKDGRIGAYKGVEMAYRNGTSFAKTSPKNDAEYHPTEYNEPRDPEHDAEHMAQPLSNAGQGYGLRYGTSMVKKYASGTAKVMKMKMPKYSGGMRGYAAGTDMVPGESDQEADSFDRFRTKNLLDESTPAGNLVENEPVGDVASITPSEVTARMRQDLGLQGYADGTARVHAAVGWEDVKNLGGRAMEGLRGMAGGAAPASAAEAATAAETARAASAASNQPMWARPGQAVFRGAGAGTKAAIDVGGKVLSRYSGPIAAAVEPIMTAVNEVDPAFYSDKNVPLTDKLAQAGRTTARVATIAVPGIVGAGGGTLAGPLSPAVSPALAYGGGQLGKFIANETIAPEGEALRRWRASQPRAAQGTQQDWAAGAPEGGAVPGGQTQMVAAGQQPAQAQAPAGGGTKGGGGGGMAAAPRNYYAAQQNNDIRSIANIGSMIGHKGAQASLQSMLSMDAKDMEMANAAADRAARLSIAQIEQAGRATGKNPLEDVKFFSNPVTKKDGTVVVPDRPDLKNTFDTVYLPQFAAGYNKRPQELTPVEQAKAALSFRLNLAAQDYAKENGKGYVITSPIDAASVKVVKDPSVLSRVFGRKRGEATAADSAFGGGVIIVRGVGDREGRQAQEIPISFLSKSGYMSDPGVADLVQGLLEPKKAR